MLRGAQTVAELKTRTERLHHFASADDVASVLARLDERRSSFGSCPASRGSARNGGRTCSPTSARQKRRQRAGEANTLEQRLAQIEDRLAELERRLDER